MTETDQHASESFNQHFDPDVIDSPIVPMYAAYSGIREHSWRPTMHHHAKGELIYVKSGTAAVRLDSGTQTIPPSQMMWIPKCLPHQVILTSEVDFRSIFIDQKYFPQLTNQLKLFFVSALLAEIIETICLSSSQTNWMCGTEFHLQSILIKEMIDLSTAPPWPALPKTKRICDYLLRFYEKRQMMPRLNVLAAHTGASERTLHRMFVQDTGMNYQQWRQRIRLIMAFELLATDKTITEIAHHLEFSSTSAFITFFKNFQNITPKKYRTLMS